MELNAIKYPIKTLRKKWPVTGNLIMPGFTPDEISVMTSTFFSNLRDVKWKSLTHTPNKGILLAGPKGIGKTINLRVIAKIISNDGNQNRRPRLISALEIQEGYKQAQENDKGAKFMDELANCPELIIDDIGNEDMKFNDFGTVRNLVADLFILRYPLFQRGLVITHGTTNLKHESLEKIYDARLIDRMKEMFVYTDIKKHYDKLGLELKSKRTDPTKVLPVEAFKPGELSDAEKRRIYLQTFIHSIPNEGVIPFFDKGPMWNFLVNNDLINPILLEDFDLRKKAMDMESKSYGNLTFGRSILDVEIMKQTYSSESEVDKNLKHLVLKRYFSENKLDLSTFTDQQIML